MDIPYFSIITPTYNRAHIIGTTIESVLNQEFENFEYIIVDDGSSDNTQHVVESYKDKRVRYFKKENEERGIARNYGITKAQGNYICFLDSDDLYYANHLSEAHEFIMANAGVSFFFQPFEVQLANGNKIRQKGFENKNALSNIANNNFLCPIGAFVKADIAKKHPFDTDPMFNIAEDLYLWLILGVRYGIVFTPTYTSCLVHHEGRTMENIDPERLEYCTEKIKELLSKDEEFGKQQTLISKIYASHLSLCSLYYSIEGRKIKSLHFTIKSIFVSFNSIFRKRTLVILRNILFRW